MGNDAPRTERLKILIDYLKHFTTLSTGSIVVVAALLGRASAPPRWPVMIMIALAAFAASVICTTLFYAFIMSLAIAAENDKPPDREKDRAFLAFKIATISFLAGVISMTAFACANVVR